MSHTLEEAKKMAEEWLGPHAVFEGVVSEHHDSSGAGEYELLYANMEDVGQTHNSPSYHIVRLWESIDDELMLSVDYEDIQFVLPPVMQMAQNLAKGQAMPEARAMRNGKEVGQTPTPNSSAGTDERKPLRLDLPDNLIPKDGGYILIHDKPRIIVMRLRCDMDDDFPIKAKMAIGDYVIALNEYTGPNTYPDIGEHIRNDLLDFQSKWNKVFGLEEVEE